jgi:phosphoserine phosphatase
MTKILLLSHSHVEGISPERFRGRADLPLTAEGGARLRGDIAPLQATWRPAAVDANPLSRSRESAVAIGRTFWARRKSIEHALAQWQFEPYRATHHPAEIDTGLVFELESLDAGARQFRFARAPRT